MPSEMVYNKDMVASKDKTEFCTVQEAALISGLSLKTWYQGGAGTGVVPRVRFGRSIRLLRSDVERFIGNRVEEAKNAVQQKN
jgi:predicted DNA-binding transcriptional regulator AlpA